MTWETIVQYAAMVLVFVVALAAMYAVLYFWTPLGTYIKHQAEQKKNAILWELAQQGYAAAEKWARSQDVSKDIIAGEKATIAYDFVTKMAKKIGVNITADQVEAMVQLAWTKLEKIPRQQNATVKVSEVMQEELKSVLKH